MKTGHRDPNSLQSYQNLQGSKLLQQKLDLLGNNHTNGASSSIWRQTTSIFTNDQKNTSALPAAPPTAAKNVQNKNNSNPLTLNTFKVEENSNLGSPSNVTSNNFRAQSVECIPQDHATSDDVSKDADIVQHKCTWTLNSVT